MKVKEILLEIIKLSKLDQVYYPWTLKTLDTDVGVNITDYAVTQRANSSYVEFTRIGNPGLPECLRPKAPTL